MKAVIHNENIRQPLVLELEGGGAGIPLFDTASEAEAFLTAMPSLSGWEVVELPDADMADDLEGFVGDPLEEDE